MNKDEQQKQPNKAQTINHIKTTSPTPVKKLKMNNPENKLKKSRKDRGAREAECVFTYNRKTMRAADLNYL